MDGDIGVIGEVEVDEGTQESGQGRGDALQVRGRAYKWVSAC